MRIKRVAASAAALLAVMVVSVDAASKKATINVVNKSKWDIHHMYMSPSDQNEWGPDQLGKNVISAKGGSFKLSDIPCDSWDIKLVDEDGDECVIEEVDVCKDQYEWKITDDELLSCQGWK